MNDGRKHTYLYTVLGEENVIFSEVDAASNYVADIVNRTKVPTDVLSSETSTVIAMIAPRLGFPANWP
jgi:hypothetical protein